MTDHTRDISPAHAEDGANLPAVAEDPFADPGLPEHLPRLTDIDRGAAKRAERRIGLLFLTSAAATIGFMVCYTQIPRDKTIDMFPAGKINASNLALGMTLGIALFALGAGAIHWARTLMTDVDEAEQRHTMASEPEKVEGAVEVLKRGADESGLAGRSFLRRSLLTAMAVLPLPAVWILRDLGPMPKQDLRHTLWAGGQLMINENTGKPLRPEDFGVGTLAFARPANLQQSADDYNEELTKASVLLVRLNPQDIKSSKEADWGYEGIVAFSRICTHVGCPVGLYEQQTHHMLCPCHQSTFDLSENGRVIFGPAARSLPQLAISVDSDGNLVSRGDFAEPVGPSFWERG